MALSTLLYISFVFLMQEKNQYWLFSFKNRQLIPKWHNNHESQALLKEKMRDSESSLLNIEIQAWLIWIIKAYCEPLITGFKSNSAQAGRGMESLQRGGRRDSDKQNLKRDHHFGPQPDTARGWENPQLKFQMCTWRIQEHVSIWPLFPSTFNVAQAAILHL